MSYSEEKMMILKMLQEGKISADDAAKLLEALEGSQKQNTGDAGSNRQQRPQQNYNDEIARMRERIHEWKNEFKKSYDEKDFDKMVDEFSTKAEKVGKTVAASTFGFVDKMVDFVSSMVDTGNFNIFGTMNAVEKVFEADVHDGMSLDLEGINGQIFVRKNPENKLVIKATVKTMLDNADNILLYACTENEVSLKINRTPNLSVSLEVLLPAVKYDKVKLNTVNGRFYIEDTLANDFECVTKNGSIDMMGVTSDKITVSTKNAKISLNYITGRDVEINTNNSLIDIKNIKAEKIKAATANGRIGLENVQLPEGSSEAFIGLKTTNGGIKVNMNDMDNKAYKVKAQTTNGRVNLLIPEVLFHNPMGPGYRGNFVDAETSDFSNHPQRISILAETANGYIEIVK